MTLEYNTLSITMEKEKAGGRDETNEGVGGERDISNQQNGGKGLIMRISYDASGKVLWGCEPRRPRGGRTTTGMVIQVC